MDALSEKHFSYAKTAGEFLNTAARPLLILKSVSWDDELRTRFLKTGHIPDPKYFPIDIDDSLMAIQAARKTIAGDHVVFSWLRRLADDLEITAKMISARGTVDFFTYSTQLYGLPKRLMIDGSTRVIDLARHMDATLDGLDHDKLVIKGYEQHYDAHTFAQKLRPLLKDHFGKSSPKVEISNTLSAKAVAGAKRIRVRANTIFTDRDIDQLLQHEAFVHTATALNGRAQAHFPLLGRAHAGTTEIQEGLAVFAEIISGAMDPLRFRRLSDRVIAIQNAIDGADFNDVFDFYRDRTSDANQAYENTRRIFRGGVLSGGAPFTKDMVYLNGLLRVHNFMRTVVKLERADLIRILFSGKMDLEDVPAFAQMASVGRLTPPKFLPPWAKDLRFLVSYMAYSGFLNQVKMPGFQSYYQKALAGVPIVWDFAS